LWADVFVYPSHTPEKRREWGYIYYSSVYVIKFLGMKGKVAALGTSQANFKMKRMNRVSCFNENGHLID
jgi:hypothetical protein